jgi:uncharacterized protein (DUF169 family)
MAENLKELSQRLVAHLGLATKPLGFKFIKCADELKDIKGIKRSSFKRPLCQFVGSARYHGHGWGVLPEDHLCHWGAWCAGVFPEPPKAIIYGSLYTDKGLNIADDDTARMLAAALPKVAEKYDGFAVMPLDGGGASDSITFEPDLVIIYGEPAQIGNLIMPACAALGIPAIEGRIFGDTAICADGIAASWNSGQPSFFLPCIGDRAMGGALPNEVAVVFPVSMFNEKVVSNIEKLKFSPNWLLEAPIGACPEMLGLMKAASASNFPLSRGTPVIPEKEDEP